MAAGAVVERFGDGQLVNQTPGGCSTVSSSGGVSEGRDNDIPEHVEVSPFIMNEAEMEAHKGRMRGLFESWYQTHMSGIVTTENPSNVSQTGARGTWKQIWKAKCDARLPYLYDVCTPGIVEEAILWPMMNVPWVGLSGNVDLLGSVVPASSWMGGLHFSKIPGSKKESWLCTEGKMQSNYRETVVREVIRNIEINSVSILRKIKEKEGGGSEGFMLSEIPDWMRGGYVRGTDIRDVIKAKTGAGGSQGRRLRTKPVEQVDTSKHVVNTVYAQLSKTSTAGRRRLRDAYFGKAGYVHVPWDKNPVVGSAQAIHVDQSTLKMRFPEASEGLLRTALHSIPDAKLITETRDQRETDRLNLLLYEGLEKTFGALRVELEHEGVVKELGQWVRKTDAGESFRKLVAFACTLFTLMQRYDNMRESNNVLSKLHEVSVGSLRLDQLMPCEYRIFIVLDHKFLGLY